MTSHARILSGVVLHKRFLPTKHFFNYRLSMYSIPLKGSEADINERLKKDGLYGVFRRKDYFGNTEEELDTAVLRKASELSQKKIQGKVTFVGQLSRLGLYFSPVNFYLISPSEKTDVEYILADVTNTPWQEKYCYLVNVKECLPHDKEFHVSPFNPMDMKYHWTLKVSEKEAFVKITCRRKYSEFEAEMSLREDSKKNQVSPFIHLKVIGGIYWQALKLFFKRVPFHSHPKEKEVLCSSKK